MFFNDAPTITFKGYRTAPKGRVLNAAECIKVKKDPVKKKKPVVPRKLTYKEQRELDSLPLKIEKLEEKQKALYSLLADLSFYQRDPAEIAQTKARSASLSDELQKAYQRWEYLEELSE